MEVIGLYEYSYSIRLFGREVSGRVVGNAPLGALKRRLVFAGEVLLSFVGR